MVNDDEDDDDSNEDADNNDNNLNFKFSISFIFKLSSILVHTWLVYNFGCGLSHVQTSHVVSLAITSLWS